MTDQAFPRPPLAVALLRLAGPVALARLGIMGMGVADTVMVGQLAPDELGAQALGWAPTGVFLVTAIGLLAGVQVLAARVVGEGRPQAAGDAWRGGLIIAGLAGLVAILAIAGFGERLLLVFGVDATLAEPAARVAAILGLSIPLHLAYVASAFYLEAVQRPGASMAAMWAANAVNIALNAWLIPPFGAEGSAWATVGSRAFLAAVLIAFILWSPALARFGSRGLSIAGVGLRALLAVGVAAAVSQAVEAGAFSAMTVIAARISEDAVAAYAILLNQLAVVFMIALGLAAATAVLVSEAIGRGAKTEATAAGWMGLGLNTGFMVAAAVIVVIAGGALARAFTADPAVAGLVAGAAGLVALVLIPDGGQVVMASALRARGDNWAPTASHILAYAIIMPPLGFWLAERLGRGVAGLIEAIVWASVVSLGVLMARFWALSRSRP